MEEQEPLERVGEKGLCICPYCESSTYMVFPFCITCGKKIRFCDVCEQPLPLKVEFCPECGARVK